LGLYVGRGPIYARVRGLASHQKKETGVKMKVKFLVDPEKVRYNERP